MQTLRTDEFKEQKIKIFIPKLAADHELCPTTAVLPMLRKTCALESKALLSFMEGDRLRCFSADRFNSILRNVLRTAWISSAKISTQSFRRGGATFASEVGTSANTFKAQGNWRGDCYARYISRDEQLSTELSSAFASAIPLSLPTITEMDPHNVP